MTLRKTVFVLMLAAAAAPAAKAGEVKSASSEEATVSLGPPPPETKKKVDWSNATVPGKDATMVPTAIPDGDAGAGDKTLPSTIPSFQTQPPAPQNAEPLADRPSVSTQAR